MKALTLHQPWASLVALGHKRFETRSWSTKHRGLLAIHAARRPMDQIGLGLLRDLRHDHGLDVQPSRMPFGCVVAVARLSSLISSDRCNGISNLEQACGDFSPGRFAWWFESVSPVGPWPARGRQGLWEWDEREEAQAS